MQNYKQDWQKIIAEVLHTEAEKLIVETPPKPEMGDLGFPMFAFAKTLKKAPAQIAKEVVEEINREPREQNKDEVFAVGPYVNVRLDRASVAQSILADAGLKEQSLKGQRIMVEFSSPNTNKPLHLGHLRNDALGESISRILSASGAEVRRVCIINDRGTHICKSMLAYQKCGEGKTPEGEHIKSDHFVGDYYVRYNDMEKENPALLQEAQEMLRKWETGDPETLALWKQMNTWTIEGWMQTYKRTGVHFDQFYYESKTYLSGKDEVLKGLADGVFFKVEDGSVQIDLNDEGLDNKVLLRKDGTSIYITQDIGTAIHRHEDWPFDRLVFVVGSEQNYHFQVLFIILKRLGFEWAKDLYHLSYGMVNLPEGKMKSREGTVVDADDLIDSLRDMALEEIRSKDREALVGDAMDVADKIALGALHYYLLSKTPAKDMLFDPKESLSFNGDTGPYLQYMGARICALLRKAQIKEQGAGSKEHPNAATCSLLPAPSINDLEWELIRIISNYSDAVVQAATKMDPSALANYLYELSRSFSRFYHDCPILNAETPELVSFRLEICKAVEKILRDALELICIPFMETM